MLDIPNDLRRHQLAGDALVLHCMAQMRHATVLGCLKIERGNAWLVDEQVSISGA
jgi:hypothetical protein